MDTRRERVGKLDSHLAAQIDKWQTGEKEMKTMQEALDLIIDLIRGQDQMCLQLKELNDEIEELRGQSQTKSAN